MNPNDDQAVFRRHSRSTGPASFETLKEYASKFVYIHGKFYNI